MIRTVILGADTPDAGELVRILSMHPDIELVCAQAYGKEGRALDYFERLAQIAPQWKHTAQVLLQVGAVHFQNRDYYAAAEAFIQEAMEYDDEDISTIDNMGWLNYYQQDVDAAKARFKQAIATNARYSPALAGMAAIAERILEKLV